MNLRGFAITYGVIAFSLVSGIEAYAQSSDNVSNQTSVYTDMINNELLSLSKTEFSDMDTDYSMLNEFEDFLRNASDQEREEFQFVFKNYLTNFQELANNGAYPQRFVNVLEKMDNKIDMAISKIINEETLDNKIDTAVELSVIRDELIKTRNKLGLIESTYVDGSEKDKLINELSEKEFELLKVRTVVELVHAGQTITDSKLKIIEETVTQILSERKAPEKNYADDDNNKLFNLILTINEDTFGSNNTIFSETFSHNTETNSTTIEPPVTNSTTIEPPVTNSTTIEPPVTNSTTIEAQIFTEKPIYYTQNDVDKIIIYGLLPNDLEICETVPGPNEGFVCDPLGAGPSIEVVDPTGLERSTLSYVPDFSDDVFIITGLDFETSQWRTNYVSTPGMYAINLYSGNGGSGEILASTIFLMLEGSAIELPPTNGTTTEPPATNGTTTEPPATNGTTTEPPATNGTTTNPPPTNGTTIDPPTTNGTNYTGSNTNNTNPDSEIQTTMNIEITDDKVLIFGTVNPNEIILTNGPSVQSIKPDGTGGIVTSLSNAFDWNGTNYSTFNLLLNFLDVQGNTTFKLWSGNGASGEILIQKTAFVTFSGTLPGDNSTDNGGTNSTSTAEPANSPPINGTTTDPPPTNGTTTDPPPTNDTTTNDYNQGVESDEQLPFIITDKSVYYQEPNLTIYVSGGISPGLEFVSEGVLGMNRILFTQYNPDGKITNRWSIRENVQNTDGPYFWLTFGPLNPPPEPGIWKMEIATGSFFNLDVLATTTYSILPSSTNGTTIDPPPTNGTTIDPPSANGTGTDGGNGTEINFGNGTNIILDSSTQ